MLDPETKRKLREMGVSEIVAALDLMNKDSSYSELSFDEYLRTAVDIAHQEQENAKVKRLIARAHFRLPQADSSNIIYDGRSLDRQLICSLASAQFVASATDVVLEGVTGTGKSHLHALSASRHASMGSRQPTYACRACLKSAR